MIKYNKLLAKYKKFWDKFSNDIKTKFDNELAYNEKHPKKKSGKVNKNFYDDGIPKEHSRCICLPVILIDSIYKTDKIMVFKYF